MEEVVRVSSYEQVIGKQVILQNVAFHVTAGEIVGLIGPSGAGKTTLIRTLIGLQVPTKGTIDVFGVRQPSLAVSKRIGYMAQHDALYEDLNAHQNLAYFGKLYEMSPSRLKTRIAEVLRLVKLDREEKKPVKYYSGGMKRRLSLALALLHEPELIILDEPTVGVDPVLKQEFWAEFERLRANGVTLLVTTHVMDEAERCQRLLLIHDGRLIESGTPEQLKERFGDIEAAFIREVTT